MRRQWVNGEMNLRTWRLYMAIVFVTGVFGLAAVNAAQPGKPSRSEAALVEAETQRFNAQIARDEEALKTALADDLTYTHATGRVQNKNEYLQGFVSGNARYQSIDVTDRVVHVDGSMGMTTGVITLTVGNGMRLTSRYTGVYLKRKGRWQLLAWQTTDIRAPAPV